MLGRDQGLNSCSGRFWLVHQGDGNVVLYDNESASAIWSSGTHGQTSEVLIMDGNLVLYAPGAPLWSAPVWASGTNR